MQALLLPLLIQGAVLSAPTYRWDPKFTWTDGRVAHILGNYAGVTSISAILGATTNLSPLERSLIGFVVTVGAFTVKENYIDELNSEADMLANAMGGVAGFAFSIAFL